MEVAFVGEVLNDVVGIVEIGLATGMVGDSSGVITSVVFDTTSNTDSNEVGISWRTRERSSA